MTEPEGEQTPPLGAAPGGMDKTRTLANPAAPRAWAGRTTFSPDQIVAGRFRIVRFIAQGGMGEVYEAADLELGEPVALKTVRPDVTADERMLARFKQEIQLARKVTHPNVCRMFDLFRHRVAVAPGEPESEVAFLTMELLRGETLADRLHRDGRMAGPPALRIAGQLAAALGTAHRAGIIHRDFKPGNVLLVPAPEPEEVRAVVTDFGLARTIAPGYHRPALTLAGGVLGTPAYMAPEQVEGGEATAATDIYALGLVLYEMVTGRQPFAAATPFAAAARRLRGPPAPPRSHVPDLDPSWDRVILRCLEREPARRFASAEEVAMALRGEPARRPWRGWLVVAGITLLILLSAAIAFFSARRVPEAAVPQASRPSAGQIQARRSIAVLGFKDLSGRPDTAWLSTAFAELLATELSAGGKLRTIPGENVARMKVELSVSEAESLGKDSLARIRKNLGSDFVVLGAYLAVGGKVRLDLRLQDAAAGETIAVVTETGSEPDLLNLVSRTGARLRQQLGAGEPSAAVLGAVRASYPAKPAAARLYAEGLAKLRLFEAISARNLLEKAVAADPRHPLSHAALAAAWSALGYGEKAKQEAQRAMDLSANLSQEERLWVEGACREISQDWAKAVEIYRSLFSFFPDNLEYGLRLAAAQTSAGKGREALASVEELRKLPPPAADDPRIDLAEASAARSLSDFRRQHQATSRAADKARAQGAVLLAARARMSEGSALWSLGELKTARAAYEAAGQIYAAAGDRGGVAQAQSNLGNVYYTEGDYAGARQRYERALAVAREIGDQAGTMNTLNSMAALIYGQGRLAEAREMFSQVLRVAREIGDRRRVASTLNNIGGVYYSLGDLPNARQRYEESLSVCREIGNRRGQAVALNNLAEVLWLWGSLAEAGRLFEQALEIRRGIGDKAGVAVVLNNLARVQKDRGDLATAKRTCQESLKLREELGAKGSTAETQGVLAEVLLEQGQLAEAEALARAAAEEFRKQKRADDEASARGLLARCLLAQKKTAEARMTVREAVGLAEKSQNRSVRLAVRITAARVRAASGEAAAAAQSLDAVFAEATQARALGLQWEARLAWGEAELKSRNPALGEASLKALEKEAAAAGFGLVARKAALALRR
ncbi:MAG: tetratricopeptide repeat protein [Acidobacteriota bacterium]